MYLTLRFGRFHYCLGQGPASFHFATDSEAVNVAFKGGFWARLTEQSVSCAWIDLYEKSKQQPAAWFCKSHDDLVSRPLRLRNVWRYAKPILAFHMPLEVVPVARTLREATDRHWQWFYQCIESVKRRDSFDYRGERVGTWGWSWSDSPVFGRVCTRLCGKSCISTRIFTCPWLYQLYQYGFWGSWTIYDI